MTFSHIGAAEGSEDRSEDPAVWYSGLLGAYSHFSFLRLGRRIQKGKKLHRGQAKYAQGRWDFG